MQETQYLKTILGISFYSLCNNILNILKNTFQPSYAFSTMISVESSHFQSWPGLETSNSNIFHILSISHILQYDHEVLSEALDNFGFEWGFMQVNHKTHKQHFL